MIVLTSVQIKEKAALVLIVELCQSDVCENTATQIKSTIGTGSIHPARPLPKPCRVDQLRSARFAAVVRITE
jgi:hypothetical protein